MQFIKPDMTSDFIGKTKFAFILSQILILIDIVLVIHKDNYGINLSMSLHYVKFKTYTRIKRSLIPHSNNLKEFSVQQLGEKGNMST